MAGLESARIVAPRNQVGQQEVEVTHANWALSDSEWLEACESCGSWTHYATRLGIDAVLAKRPKDGFTLEESSGRSWVSSVASSIRMYPNGGGDIQIMEALDDLLVSERAKITHAKGFTLEQITDVLDKVLMREVFWNSYDVRDKILAEFTLKSDMPLPASFTREEVREAIQKATAQKPFWGVPPVGFSKAVCSILTSKPKTPEERVTIEDVEIMDGHYVSRHEKRLYVDGVEVKPDDVLSYARLGKIAQLKEAQNG
jgi:hypothetical protein